MRGRWANTWIQSCNSLIPISTIWIPQLVIVIRITWWCPKFTFPTFTPDPNLHFPHLHRTQIYTNPNLHKPRFTPDPNLHSPPLIYPNLHNSNLHKTEPKFTQTQIYTGPNLHSHFWTDFKQPKFTQPKFTQNPNLHSPNLRNSNLHKTQNYKTQIYTKLKTTQFSSVEPWFGKRPLISDFFPEAFT